MFTKKTVESPEITEAINMLVTRLNDPELPTKDFLALNQQLTNLLTLRDSASSKPVSRDTVALIAGNLAGILVIVSYEHAHVVASKALGFVTKLK